MNAADAVNIRRRIGSRERDPEEVGQRPGGEIAVIDDDDEGKAVERAVGSKLAHEKRAWSDCGRGSRVLRCAGDSG